MEPALLLAMVPIVTDVRISELTAAAAAACELRSGVRLLDEEQTFVLAGDRSRRLLDCGSDMSCMTEHLRVLDASLALIVIVSDVGDQRLVDVRLVDVDRREVTATSARRSPGTADLREAVQARIDAVLDEAGFTRGARLVVDIVPNEAEISVGDRPVGPSRRITVEPGHHVVRAEHDDFLPGRLELDVTGGEERRVSLALEPAPPPLYATWWFWTAVGGAVVVGTVVGIAVATRPDPVYCAARPGAACP